MVSKLRLDGIGTTDSAAPQNDVSLPRYFAEFCAVLSVFLGSVVLLGWAIQARVLIQVSPDLPPMERGTALCFILIGLALWGVANARPGLALPGSALAAVVAVVSALASAMPPAAAFCFVALAAGFGLAHIVPGPGRSQILGAAGLLASALAAACGIGVLWGNGQAFSLGHWTHMALLTAAGLEMLGIATVVVALDAGQTALREPAWAPIGVGLVVVVIRLALLDAFAPQRHDTLSSVLAVLGGLLGAVIFGAFVHLALRIRLQRELLRAANTRLAEEMLERERAEDIARDANEQLGQRVEERTRALQLANRDLRNEIARRERVEEDLHRQKEILQTVFDHVPVCINFIDKTGRLQMANREWERMIGYTVEQIRSQNVDIFSEAYPDVLERQRAIAFTASSTSEWADFETRRDGRSIHTTWAVVRLSDGSRIGIGQDITERKEAERELRRQKEILQTIFDHIPVMINSGDDDYALRLVNREWERTLGWTVQELQEGKIDILVENYPDPEYRKQVLDFVLRRSGEWRDFKTRVRDGRVIDTSWIMLRLPDGTNIGIGQDITWRKQAEAALRESEERFRQLAENIKDLFWIKTADFKRALYLSPAFERISGRKAEERYQEVDYGPFLNTIHPEDRGRMVQIIESGLEEQFDIEFRLIRPDGAVRWIHDRGFPIRDASGQVYRIAGIASDITERKMADEALREGEERFRQLTENIREVFWITTADFSRQVYISPGFRNLTGEHPEMLYPGEGHKPFFAFVYPEDQPRLREITENPGEGFDVEYRMLRADGSIRWVRDRGFPMRNQHGEIYRFGGVAEDITERKEAENRLQATSEQLRALSANLQSAREEEATRIARQIHDDLGGVLTGLRWELEALAKMIHEAGDLGPLKPAMHLKLATMLGLTDTTINVVRRIASELRPSILDDLGLMEAIEWQAEQFQARTGIECQCDCAVQGFELGDQQATALFRIFQEALTNILRHARATRVHVAMKEEQADLVLTVSDNGRGITEAEKRGRSSLGILGMQERAHLIGGHIEVAGEMGAGTTLHVRLPLEDCRPNDGCRSRQQAGGGR